MKKLDLRKRHSFHILKNQAKDRKVDKKRQIHAKNNNSKACFEDAECGIKQNKISYTATVL
jgi:hypothetical protein